MPNPQYAHNHTIEPETGYIENNAYPFAFNAEKKKAFIKCLVENGLGLYETCEVMGINHQTLFKHYHNDPAFKEDFDEARREYGHRLDAISKRNAMNPRSVIERIFQLKSIFPEKYGDQRSSGNITVNISVDENLLQNIKKRQEVIDIDPVDVLAREPSVLSASTDDKKQISVENIE